MTSQTMCGKAGIRRTFLLPNTAGFGPAVLPALGIAMAIAAGTAHAQAGAENRTAPPTISTYAVTVTPVAAPAQTGTLLYTGGFANAEQLRSEMESHRWWSNGN